MYSFSPTYRCALSKMVINRSQLAHADHLHTVHTHNTVVVASEPHNSGRAVSPVHTSTSRTRPRPRCMRVTLPPAKLLALVPAFSRASTGRCVASTGRCVATLASQTLLAVSDAVRCSSRGYPRLDLYTAFAVCSMRVEQFNVLLRTPS